VVAFNSPTFPDQTANDPLAVQNFHQPTSLEKSEEFPDLYIRPKNDSDSDPEVFVLVMMVGQGDSDSLRNKLLGVCDVYRAVFFLVLCFSSY
jgi:hypothetical protein